ncbi:MAG: hypothetical protein GY820_07645, partial [Gammaproteobacteria bacterium]|nr:hypothetical protein [Gammaproteobacteria bacterium]
GHFSAAVGSRHHPVRLKGEGMQLERSGAESAVMTRQRDQDQIELHKRKKRGERRRADAMAAAEYVDTLNEQLTCQSCQEQGAPLLSTLAWKPPTNECDTEDEEQWRWIKCAQCPDGRNLFHTSCVDPSLYQDNSESFICEYCICHCVLHKDGSSYANCLKSVLQIIKSCAIVGCFHFLPYIFGRSNYDNFVN